jgi:hypothetical protein
MHVAVVLGSGDARGRARHRAVNAVLTLDFHRAAEMGELGRQVTVEALDHAGY